MSKLKWGAYLRKFDYDTTCNTLFTKEIVALLTQIHEYKGKQTLFVEAKPDVLAQMTEVAKIQSADSSNRIEGIYTSEDRLEKLVKDKTNPKNRNEQEIAGYRDVLSTIHESYDFIPPRLSMILQLHRDLYKFSGFAFGGMYKTANEEDGSGKKFVRFQPAEAWETTDAMEEICAAFEKASGSGQTDLLLAIPVFILDFLCIHPFSDGNGRMSRLLTLLFLYRAGYIIGKYISIEKYIERSKDTYYETLEQSSLHWHKGMNNYTSFVEYMLGVILAAYRDFASGVEFLTTNGLSKSARVKETIKGRLGKITKKEILAQCPDISQITVQRALNDLLKNGDIIKLSGGRYTNYTWNRERD